MIENISRTDLSELSDSMLIEKLICLNKKETELTGEIFLHLIELEKRKLFREKGYSSLYSYCVAELRYSPSAAKRRLTAARCIARFPGIYELFVQKQVSLTTLSIIAPVLREENQEDILRQVSGKSPQEVEWIAGRYNPTKPSSDRIIPIVVQTETVKPANIFARWIQVYVYLKRGSTLRGFLWAASRPYRSAWKGRKRCSFQPSGALWKSQSACR